MGEGGLDAIRSIKQIINDQDEKIWRVSAIEKCMKKEIEKLLTESKQYEVQIETLKSNSPYRCTKDVPLLVKDAIDHEIQTHKFLLIAIDSKKIEIENKKRDIKLWEEKYQSVITDFQEAYDDRKAFYELHNHAFKHLKQSEVAKKLAFIEMKRLKAELESVKRISTELKFIKRKILYTKIINFVKAISRQRQNVELNVKLQKAIARKRELGAIMLEKQKAWKTQNSMNIHQRKNNIFSNMVAKIDFSKRDTMPNKQGISKCSENHSARINVEIKPKLDKTPVDDKSKPTQKNNEEIKQNCNKIKVIDNQKISLPPLKSILNESRPNSKTGKLSQDSNFSERSQLQIKPSATEKVKNTLKEMNVVKKIATDQSLPPNRSHNVSFERLKNLKLITEKPQSIANKSPMKFSFKNRYTAENLNQQKMSMLGAEAKKRKTDSEQINDDIEIPPTKKDRSVNFASPIEEHCDTMDCSPNQKIDIDATLQSNISLLGYNTLEEETVLPTDCYQGIKFTLNINCSIV
ncbi:hypothetical protein WA026_003817 [Henosepilachna vigintioctopunctata]|uniref:Uncharacterized protein n=1 Tax=Henosepilachna vigintioctopunctata TaxID=420089 RepID=A0AAW1UEG6_9CUCU